MAKIEIDIDQLRLAVKLLYDSKEYVNESFYRFRALNAEFQNDMQLQTVTEYPQITDVCTRIHNLHLQLSDLLEDLYTKFYQLPQLYETVERACVEKLKGITVKSEMVQNNISDVAAISIGVTSETDDDVRILSDVTELVYKSSYSMSLASTATAVKAIKETYSDSVLASSESEDNHD